MTATFNDIRMHQPARSHEQSYIRMSHQGFCLLVSLPSPESMVQTN